MEARSAGTKTTETIREKHTPIEENIPKSRMAVR
jgi:hypothetical protein